MDEFKFVVKTLLATILVIALMQIKVGEKTFEAKAYKVLAQSKLADFLNGVARGAVKGANELKVYLHEQIQKAEAPAATGQ